MSPSKKQYFMAYNNLSEIEQQGKQTIRSKARFYYWVGIKSGLLWYHSKEVTPKTNHGDKLKYLGWTEDSSWPKKLNTGRIIHKPIGKSKKKRKLQ